MDTRRMMRLVWLWRPCMSTASLKHRPASLSWLTSVIDQSDASTYEPRSYGRTEFVPVGVATPSIKRLLLVYVTAVTVRESISREVTVARANAERAGKEFVLGPALHARLTKAHVECELVHHMVILELMCTFREYASHFSLHQNLLAYFEGWTVGFDPPPANPEAQEP